MAQGYCRMEDQKQGPVCWLVTGILLNGEDLNQKLKSLPKISNLGDVVSQRS